MLARDSRTLIAQYRRDLEAQLQRRDLRQEIEWLRETYPVFEKYASIEDLAALVRPGNPAYADKDAVLGILVARIQTGRHRTLFPLLNLVFWDSLMRIFRRKRRACANPDDLFSRIQADFFHVAITYPLDRRPRKIDVNLVLDTKKKVTAWQRDEAKYRQSHEYLGPGHEACTALADLQESEIFPEEMEAYLLDLVYRKVINQNQYDLLLETEVYKRMTQKEWAEARVVKHTTARSWRHRAEMATQEYERARLKNTTPEMA